MTHEHAVETMAAERYLLNDMAELERFDFEAHYFSCADCAEDIRTGAVMRDGVRAGFAPAAGSRASASTPQSRGRWQVVLPWAAAASLAVVAGYQSFVALPRSGERIELQALSPVSLRPASRGAMPTVVLGKNGIAALAVDVNLADAQSTLSYELSAAGGSVVASGEAPAPASGAPLLLMVPGSTLRSAGEYVLVVRAAAGASTAEYHFVVAQSVATPPVGSR
jgi:hypothetical protein